MKFPRNKIFKQSFIWVSLLLSIILLFIWGIIWNTHEGYENAKNSPPPKICFITAIYGDYEKSCKNFVKQTVPTDFICFTNNEKIISNGWTIDKTPYHSENKSVIDNNSYINSLTNNKHTFNIAKYYKQQFQQIPRLKKYDAVVWIDGTIEITNEKTSEYILKHIYDKKIIGWNHEERGGILKDEMIASHFERYTSTEWGGQKQPYQDIDKQYDFYVKDGYDETFFKKINPSPHFGMWVTCFVAFLNNDASVTKFLNLWYLQTLKFTTQDQIGFPYVSQKLNLIPFTLPNDEIKGERPHSQTDFYKKHEHNK